MISTPLPGDLTLEISEFVAQVIFNSLSLLIRRCRLHDLQDSGRNYGSTIAGIYVADAAPGMLLVRDGKVLHFAFVLAGKRAPAFYGRRSVHP
jgi:hypothetical protein